MNINAFEKISHRHKNIRHFAIKQHAGFYVCLYIYAVHMFIVYVNLHIFLYKGMYIYSYKLSHLCMYTLSYVYSQAIKSRNNLLITAYHIFVYHSSMINHFQGNVLSQRENYQNYKTDFKTPT